MKEWFVGDDSVRICPLKSALAQCWADGKAAGLCGKKPNCSPKHFKQLKKPKQFL